MQLSISHAKSWWEENELNAITGLAFVFVGILAFLLGRISIVSETKNPLIIEVPNAVLQKQAETEKSGSLTYLALSDSGMAQSSGIPEAERRGEYVASKNGAYYYTANMYMATRISPKNRIWFNSRKEAEKRGLKPAKGLTQ